MEIKCTATCTECFKNYLNRSSINFCYMIFMHLKHKTSWAYAILCRHYMYCWYETHILKHIFFTHWWLQCFFSPNEGRHFFSFSLILGASSVEEWCICCCENLPKVPLRSRCVYNFGQINITLFCRGVSR